jgi:drug/metabolite transporter (DMT)-like permease
VQRETLGLLAACLSSLLGGSAVVATRYIVGQTDPLTLALLRYAIGVAILLPIALLLRKSHIARRDIPALILLGILFFAVFPTLFNASLAYTTAARGSLALSTLPLLTLGVAALAGAEQMTGAKLAGVTVAILGVAVALSGDLATPAAPEAWRGDLIMVATALCGAIYNVAARPLLRRYPALVFTAWAMLAGTAALALTTGAGHASLHISAWGWVVVAYLGVIGAALTFMLWSWALERTTPTRVAISVTLNPVSSMALGALWLEEALSPRLVLGLLAVLTGIALAAWPLRAPQTPPTQSG